MCVCPYKYKHRVRVSGENGIPICPIPVPIADTDCGVPTTGISGKMILILDRYLKTPYILTNKRLRLYEESVAAQILLMGIQDWVEQKSKISEKSQ